MPPKKKKEKKKKVQISIDTTPLKVIEPEEYFKRHHRHDFRLAAIQENNEAFARLKEQYDEKIQLEKELREWKNYVQCDKMPNLESPPSIRAYLYQWHFNEWQRRNRRFHWSLDIDERSILTQDMTAKDLTREKLKVNAPAYGMWSVTHIQNARKMIVGLEELLDRKESDRLIFHKELEKVKHEIRNRIRHNIDNFSYFILFDTKGNMEVIDRFLKKYDLHSEPLDMALRSLRNLPFDFEKLGVTELFFNLDAIDSSVTLPLYAIYDNLVIRGLHLKFDHRSCYATSWKLHEYLPEYEDLRNTLIKEWDTKKHLQDNKLKQMRKERHRYEEEMKAYEEEVKKAEANKNKPDLGGKPEKKSKAPKKLKIPVELPAVSDTTFLDVEYDFIENDDREHIRNMDRMLPQTLNLEEDEINLREYIILGGVYEFNLLHKPIQLQSNYCSLNVKNIPEKLQYKHFTCLVEYQPRKIQSKSFMSKDSRQMSAAEVLHGQTSRDLSPLISKLHGEVKFHTLMKLTVKLPPYLCRWQRPETCRWCVKLHLTPDQKEDDQMSIFSTLMAARHIQPFVTKDIDMTTAKGRKNLQYIITEQILPRMDSLHKFPDELAEENMRDTARFNELERLRKEAELDYGATDMLFRPSKPFIPRIIAESTPPASLFPRPTKIRTLKLRSSDFLCEQFPEEIKNLCDSDQILLSQYLEELDRLAESRKPQFLTWMAIMKLLNKDKTSAHSNTDLDDKHSSSRLRHDSERHLRKSSKKSKPRMTLRLGSKRSMTKLSSSSIRSNPSLGNENSTSGMRETMKDPKVFTEEDEAYSTDPGFWSTEYVFKEDFNEDTAQMTFWTDRLGIFGFAFKRYLHFPFKNWLLYPDSKSKNIIILEIVSQYARFIVNIGKKGYTATVMIGGHVHAKLAEPTTDLRKFIFDMESLGLNIFTKIDTAIYVREVSEKYVPLESYVYQTLSQFCFLYKFCRSKWNWLAHRRVFVLKLGQPQFHTYEMDTIQVTPEESRFCVVTEMCTPLDQVVLEYSPTSKNKKFEPDLYSLINSFSTISIEHRPKVEYAVYKLLKAVRPLTFCK